MKWPFSKDADGGNQHASDVAAHTANRRANRYCPGRCRYCHDDKQNTDYAALLAAGWSERAADDEAERRRQRGDYGQR